MLKNLRKRINERVSLMEVRTRLTVAAQALRGEAIPVFVLTRTVDSYQGIERRLRTALAVSDGEITRLVKVHDEEMGQLRAEYEDRLVSLQDMFNDEVRLKMQFQSEVLAIRSRLGEYFAPGTVGRRASIIRGELRELIGLSKACSP